MTSEDLKKELAELEGMILAEYVSNATLPKLRPLVVRRKCIIAFLQAETNYEVALRKSYRDENHARRSQARASKKLNRAYDALCESQWIACVKCGALTDDPINRDNKAYCLDCYCKIAPPVTVGERGVW